ncbi:MAG: universal stress protein [Thaumarchaeota archaeon]|nr:universal stress protein [Nitrososphaerota archaeon]
MAPTKQQIATILALVDGSEPSTHAVKTALDLAQKYGSTVINLSVVSPPSFMPVGTGGSPTDLSVYYDKGIADAKSAVDNALKLSQAAGVSARGEVIEAAGSIVDTIVDFATKEKVDLIVMGTRGLGGLKKLVLGSVSSGVASRAPCSVLVVR